VEATIRKATAEDYSPLCGLFDEVDVLHRANLPHLFQRPNGPVREPDYYRGLIADKDVGLFVVEIGEKLVGFVHAVVRDAPPIPILVPRRYAIVESVGVKPGFQKHGMGRLLMDTVQEWATAEGATSIELNVFEFNETAIEFYEKLGYETLSRKMIKELNRGRAG
jgi:ribosomal protein S18 acetylase RimI-like enzyme